MSTSILHLSEELITKICSYVPTQIGALRLACKELSGKALFALRDNYFRTVHLIPSTRGMSINCLESLCEDGCGLRSEIKELYLSGINEMVVHYNVYSWPAKEDLARHEDNIDQEINRFDKVLRKVLPNLPNCKRITFSDEEPLGPSGKVVFLGSTHFRLCARRSWKAERIFQCSGSLPHLKACALKWEVLSAIAESQNAVAALSFYDPMTPLRDLRSGLGSKPCAALMSTGVRDVLVSFFAGSYRSYMLDYFQEHVSHEAMPPAEPIDQPEHACLKRVTSSLPQWERGGKDKAIIASFLSHFPNIERLSLAVYNKLWEGLPEFDVVTSYFPEALTTFQFMSFLGNRVEFSQLLSRLRHLKKLLLVNTGFPDLDVLRTVLNGYIKHEPILSLRVLEPKSFQHQQGYTHICLGTCAGRWCKQSCHFSDENACEEATPAFDSDSDEVVSGMPCQAEGADILRRGLGRQLSDFV